MCALTYRLSLVLAGLVWTCIATTFCGCSQTSGFVNNRAGQGSTSRGTTPRPGRRFIGRWSTIPTTRLRVQRRLLHAQAGRRARRRADVQAARCGSSRAISRRITDSPTCSVNRAAWPKHSICCVRGIRLPAARCRVVRRNGLDAAEGRRPARRGTFAAEGAQAEPVASAGARPPGTHLSADRTRTTGGRVVSPFAAGQPVPVGSAVQPRADDDPNSSGMQMAGMSPQADPTFASGERCRCRSRATEQMTGQPMTMNGQPMITYGEPIIVNGPPEMMNGQCSGQCPP